MAEESTPRVRRDSKLKITQIDINDQRTWVTFTFNRELTPLEMQGLMTIVRQAITQ